MSYSLGEQISQGSYGTVFRALSPRGGVCAVKVLTQSFGSLEEALQQSEVKLLQRMPRHPHVTSLRAHYLVESRLHLVFDYFPQNLLQLVQNSSPLTPLQVRNLSYMLLQGLAHLHHQGVIHRDIKLENILVDPLNDDLSLCRLQLADLGNCKARDALPHTNYVSTRWYRAPEQLVGSTTYDSKIDIFAAACVICEMISGQPLLPGVSELDQLVKLVELLGSPPAKGRIAEKLFKLKIELKPLTAAQAKENIKVLTGANGLIVDLLAKMLAWEASDRYSALQCLQHGYFS